MTNTASCEVPAAGIPMGTMARSARIAALPLAFGGRAVAGWGRRLAGADAEQVSASAMERNAEQLFAVLGQLKGGAMKIGQALSVYDSMIPAEIAEPYQRALAKLQSAGPTMPAKTVHAVLAEQLGRDWQRRFRSFDDTPAAAASVGQVHHAVWADGREVAVKIQYPGAGDALDADLRTLERFSRLFTLIVPALDAKALVRELRDRMLDELDYRAEADRQRRFAAAYAGDPDLHVPAVVASAPKVIVSEWLDGVSLGTMTARPAATAREQALRDDWAHTIIQTMFSSPERAGMLHADPHPGNFMVLSDGRLAMIDFGAVAELPDGFPPVLARILRHVADAEPAKMMRLMLAEGFVGGDVPAEDVLRYIGALADPLRTDTFRFHRAWMAQEGSRVLDLRGKALRSLALPPQHLVIVRVLSGWTNILALLDCTVAARALAEEWLPEF
ncbi:MAG: AarF/ABC1/UbiB kinase family protein [Pseudonocardia sp.]|uniref:ABC1 kinase family protein n=1 Tax=unclassified Pseudonocardia TaxID=2619320 RepID=UPI00086E45E5|nr:MULTISPECIES: AarF/ABC1/UbiB kinase family protein [unclassified Pseudonocardia]MBN9110236.1 AarF/ABC1/UbiB kinase family protein [Pseudonocardia sp.]ODU19983.1 MAG: ABC transporter ATP-binding protein [Pseudonocardia sp. SCN 72-51]ODV06368.1 MAG: ABC transporter ATP-binding protein [Pseudonocardia sp. SCN 73-27]